MSERLHDLLTDKVLVAIIEAADHDLAKTYDPACSELSEKDIQDELHEMRRAAIEAASEEAS